MKDLIYEIEVDEPSIIEELHVSENNFIELDYSYLDAEFDDEVQMEDEVSIYDDLEEDKGTGIDNNDDDTYDDDNEDLDF